MAHGEKIYIFFLIILAALLGVSESLRIALLPSCKGQDGQRRKLGQKYTYGCMICECTQEGEQCSSPRCAPVTCDNYISEGPGCCPTCPEVPTFTCKGQDGQLHGVGERYEYGCLTCECTEKGEMCTSPRCAPITCDNFVSEGPGCCPICPEVTCKGQDGRLHTLGDTYQYGCMPCECTEKGEQCYPLPCAPPPCDDYTTEGPGCCPICPNGPRTPAPPAPMTCAGQEGNVHAFGEWWHYGCMPCQCTDQGEQCYPLPCQPPQCENYVTDGPGCCPTCPQGADCRDPHSGTTIPVGQSMETSLDMTCYCPPGSGEGYDHRKAECYYTKGLFITTTTSEPDTTTTEPPTIIRISTFLQGCFVEGNYYEPGEHIPTSEACSFCYCYGYGQGYGCNPPACRMTPCPNPVRDGYCCPTCPNGPACRGLDEEEIPEGETKTYPDGSQCYCGYITDDDIRHGLPCTPVTPSPPLPPSTVA